MSVDQIIAEMIRRDVHVIQYMGHKRYEVWVDGYRRSSHHDPLAAEQSIRDALGIDEATGSAVETELHRRAGLM